MKRAPRHLIDLRDIYLPFQTAPNRDDVAVVRFLTHVANLQHAITQMIEAIPGATVPRDAHALVLVQRACELMRASQLHVLRQIEHGRR